MSIDIFKELNKELVEKVQELKKVNAFLEREITTLNAKYYDEHQLRVEERQKFLTVIIGLKQKIQNIGNDINNVEYILREEDMPPDSSIYQSQGSSRQRTRSSGITAKSPIRSRSSESNSGNEAQSDKSSSLNSWGFPNIEEVSSRTERCIDENTCDALSRLSINDAQEKTLRNNSPKSLETNLRPLIQVSCHNESKYDYERTIDTLRCPSNSSIEANFVGNKLAVIASPELGNSSYLTISNFSLKASHSTPKRLDTNATNSVTLSNDSTSNTNQSISRPKRSCAPTSLVEPNINTKLRNESSVRKNKGRRKR